MLTIEGHKELILLCDTAITEITCSRIGFCKPDNQQFAAGKKRITPIRIFIHISTVYKISRLDGSLLTIEHIIGYLNSKFKGYYGNIIPN